MVSGAIPTGDIRAGHFPTAIPNLVFSQLRAYPNWTFHNQINFYFVFRTYLHSGPDAAQNLREEANFSGVICVHFCCIENFSNINQ